MAVPLLADYALRMAVGVAAATVATPWRLVPPRFFRTQCHVVLGLLVLAVLAISGASGTRTQVAIVSALAGAAYFASAAWGLGLPRIGLPLTLAAAIGGAWVIVQGPTSSAPRVDLLNAASRLASAALLGSTLTAMLLGHYYLTAPAMSIQPLQRLVRMMAWSIAFRAMLAGIALAVLGSAVQSSAFTWVLLTMRWGIGIIGAVVATFLTWRTVKIRSTQSATGILYTSMILVLLGEGAALILSHGSPANL